MKITVYTQNNCRYCGSVKNYLDDQEVAYDTINVSDEPHYTDELSLMGAPTVILYDEDNEEVVRTTGYNPEELAVIIQNLG